MGLWGWEATDPEGRRVPHPFGLGAFAGKAACEKDALRWIERHANPAEELTGAELQQRVNANAAASIN